jgi:hypothetical protein
MGLLGNTLSNLATQTYVTTLIYKPLSKEDNPVAIAIQYLTKNRVFEYEIRKITK